CCRPPTVVQPAYRANGTIGTRAKYWVAAAATPPPTAIGIRLRHGRKAQARAGTGRRAVARHIFEPVEIEVLGRAGERDPVEDLRPSGVELVARQVLQELRILVGERLEDSAVEFLVDQEVAQAARGQHADPQVARERVDRLADRPAELKAAPRARLVGRK